MNEGLAKSFFPGPIMSSGRILRGGAIEFKCTKRESRRGSCYVWTKHSKDVSVTPPPARMNVPPLPSCQRRVSSSGSIFANLVMKKKRHFVSVGISLISSRVLTPFHVTQLHFLLRGRHSVLYLPGSDTFV
uniref:Uncharacterized protein n=1 Tax=Rousettus aegyptiacus TaxID=9407 RepID=A0A7J8JH20_ROUAE|nr:hypothetical protein HJG63_010385 [Rousettus aegyptiacus]